jgi:hypothetical protein
MKKVMFFAAAALVAISLSVYASADKVQVVHNGNVIEVSSSAVSAHLGHGDALYNPAPTPTPPIGTSAGPAVPSTSAPQP